MVISLAFVGVFLVLEQVLADPTPFATVTASTDSNHCRGGHGGFGGLFFGSFSSSKELESLFQAFLLEFPLEFFFIESLSSLFHLFIDFSILLLFLFGVDEPAKIIGRKWWG